MAEEIKKDAETQGEQISDEQLENVAGGVNIDALRRENLDKDASSIDELRRENLEKD